MPTLEELTGENDFAKECLYALSSAKPLGTTKIDVTKFIY